MSEPSASRMIVAVVSRIGERLVQVGCAAVLIPMFLAVFAAFGYGIFLLAQSAYEVLTTGRIGTTGLILVGFIVGCLALAGLMLVAAKCWDALKPTRFGQMLASRFGWVAARTTWVWVAASVTFGWLFMDSRAERIYSWGDVPFIIILGWGVGFVLAMFGALLGLAALRVDLNAPDRSQRMHDALIVALSTLIGVAIAWFLLGGHASIGKGS